MPDPSPAIDADVLLAESDFVRRLARGLLFDDHRIDDVVQQTWLDALRHAPRATSGPALRGWLATVVRRRVADDIAARSRREQVERDAAPTERPMPSADELIAREELRRIVVAELDALPEPYRTAVALRYLEGAKPVDIASRLGVPAATIRARVRRGLAMLREGLDRRHGGDRRAWSLALVPLAAPGSAGAVTGMAAVPHLLTAGVAVKLLLSFLTVATLAAIATVLWSAPLADPACTNSPSVATVPAETAAIPVADRRNAAERPGDREPVAMRSPTPPPPGFGMALLRGRCVDTAGEPVADARITLQGGARDLVAASTWELLHGAVDWMAPEPAISGIDGRFELEFVTLPSFAFYLATEHDALAGRAMSFEAPAPHDERDVGDLTMSEGHRVRGRVVDTTGTPVPDVHVAVVPVRENRGVTAAAPPGAGQAITASAQDVTPDGRFETRVLPPGKYGLRVYHRTIVEPDTELLLEATDLELRVVVETRAAHEANAILGVVVDATGVPIPGAAVHSGTVEPFDLHAIGSLTHTDREGRFTLRPRASTAADLESVVVSAWRDGYTAAHSPEPVVWGTRGVRLRLARGPALTVRVTDSNSGEPVPRFGIRLEPIRSRPGKTAADLVLRAVGNHANGVATLPSVTPFRYRITVVPADASRWSPSAPLEIDTTDRQPRHLAIEVRSFAVRDVRVVDDAGAPVAGARVDVLLPPDDGVVAAYTSAFSPDDAAMASGNLVTHVGDAITDDDGVARLSGPAGVDVHLRLPGPTHVPTALGPTRLDDETPLEVRVQRGVTVVGTLRPSHIIDALRADSRDAGSDLGLVLRGLGIHAGASLPPGRGSSKNPFAIGDDGSFRLTGVPPGLWRLDLWHHERLHGGTVGRSRPLVAEIRVAATPSAPLDVDLSHLVKHPVVVRVRVDGAPSLATVYAAGRLEAMARTGEERRNTNVSSDSCGVASLSLEAGRWTLQPVIHIDGAKVALDARAVDVTTNGATPAEFDFDVQLARRAVRIRGPDGAPAAGVVLETRGRASDDTEVQTGGRVFPLPRWFLQPAASPTDRDGRTELRWLAGDLHLFAARRAFREHRDPITWRSTHPKRSPADRVVDLGTVAVLDGESELEIRLPEDWNRVPD